MPERPHASSASSEPIAIAPSMVVAVYRAHAFAPAATPVILYGESGTGKTFFAEYIHRLSGRIGSMVAFSVGMLSPQLALDELFGHVQGAYTDARRMRVGLIATAGVGTLLLDDFQNLDLGVQKQLLQVLDRGSYSPVGSDRVLTVTCRIILAMTDDPDVLMHKGLLLKDLRYRLGACAIGIPPLRERRTEIALLAQQALQLCPRATGLDGPTRFTDSVITLLCEGDYPGNVRQLEGGVLFAYLLARHLGAAEIAVEHLPAELCAVIRYQRHGDPKANRIAAERAMQKAGGNMAAAARLLGISRNALAALLAGHHTRSDKSEAVND